MPTFSGSTLTMALSASWNVSGCNETGFAFGMITLSEDKTLQLRMALSAMLWDVPHVAPSHTRALPLDIHEMPHHARSDKSLTRHKSHLTSEIMPTVRLRSCPERT